MAIMRASFAGLTAKENIKKATTTGKAIAPVVRCEDPAWAS